MASTGDTVNTSESLYHSTNSDLPANSSLPGINRLPANDSLPASDGLSIRSFLVDPKLIDIWSSHKVNEVTEPDSDCEGQAGLLDVVFVPREDFNDTYSHTDGLGALMRMVPRATRSSGPPSSGEAQLAGRAEDILRKALKCERTRLLVTMAEENERTSKSHLGFFAGWEPLMPYQLPRADNLVEEVEKDIQQRWNGAKVNVQAMGNGGGLEGWFGIVHSWVNPTDWLSLYRGQASVIHAWSGRDVSKKEDLEVLENIESQLFDTTKYYGACELMTVVTYGDNKYGTISLFRITLLPGSDELAGQIEVLGYADHVPKAILKDLRMQNRIEYVQKGWQDPMYPPRRPAHAIASTCYDAYRQPQG